MYFKGVIFAEVYIIFAVLLKNTFYKLIQTMLIYFAFMSTVGFVIKMWNVIFDKDV